ncbi:hypothetical protein [Streptomyces cucumeris]|uniref:hypothetical protein n=1 Tax=Streptomyces cucumeris TaxID=2962890 RepID=UPI0020C848E0|nr:hypothetical protein [Streptomyces sp. NEAU-Y11]MCP9207823.1 hypothetical protein [Streptomyces sp. NEAU-Y11]
MAKEVIELVRCDVCGTDDDVEGFTIIRGGKPKDVDLCGEHRGPLVELYGLGVEQAAPRTKKSARTGHAVVAIEDWAPSLGAPMQSSPPDDAPAAEETPVPEEAATAELVEAARPLIGTTLLSEKVVLALAPFVRAVENGKPVTDARRPVLDLNPTRIKAPKGEQGQRFREALAAYQGSHRGAE